MTEQELWAKVWLTTWEYAMRCIGEGYSFEDAQEYAADIADKASREFRERYGNGS
jgi:hypothetical protein